MKYIPADKLIAEIERRKNENREFAQKRGYSSLGNAARIRANEDDEIISLITSLQQEQPSLPTIKGWIARDDADRLGLYDQKPTRKTEPGVFSGVTHSWVIGDTWIGRFSLDQTAKTLFPNLCWKDDPIEVELSINKK